MEDYYEILGLERTDDADTIKKRYRELAFKYHPDRNINDPDAEERFKKIGKAFAALSDPHNRSHYDQVGNIYEDHVSVPPQIDPSYFAYPTGLKPTAYRTYDEPEELWSFDLGVFSESPGYKLTQDPIIFGGNIIFPMSKSDGNSVVHVLDKESGEEVWRFAQPDSRPEMIFGNEFLFLASTDKIHVLNPDSGEVQWTRERRDNSELFVDNQNVFVKFWDQSITALKSEDGSECWNYKPPNYRRFKQYNIQINPTTGFLYVTEETSSAQNTLVKVDIRTGERTSVTKIGKGADVFTLDDLLLITTRENFRGYSWDLNVGGKIRAYPLDGDMDSLPSPLWESDGRIYRDVVYDGEQLAFAQGDTIHVLDKKTGISLLQHMVKQIGNRPSVPKQIWLNENRIYARCALHRVSGYMETLHAFGLEEQGELWYHFIDDLATPRFVDDSIYVRSGLGPYKLGGELLMDILDKESGEMRGIFNIGQSNHSSISNRVTPIFEDGIMYFQKFYSEDQVRFVAARPPAPKFEKRLV